MQLQSFYTKMAQKIYDNPALTKVIAFISNQNQSVFISEIIKNIKVERRKRVRENGKYVFKMIYDYIDRKQAEKCIEILDYMLLIDVDQESFKPNKIIYLNEHGQSVMDELDKIVNKERND